MKYLYGASIQGIQSFIFQTNKLKEIIGASELVEQICTDKFFEIANTNGNDPNIILNAAGNIKYIFEDRQKCEDFVRTFPKVVMEMAPGITISQAVVKFDEESIPTQTLEDRLRIQRNKVISTTSGIGLMAIETARRTGGLGVTYQKGVIAQKKEVIDLSQEKKIKASESGNQKLFAKVAGEKITTSEIPFDITDVVTDENKSWLAIIHADGNDLGARLMYLAENLPDDKLLKAIKSFSGKLETATITSARAAYQIIKKLPEKKIPFRPVILGGDDLTIIIRGDLALDFTVRFLEEFEKKSKEIFGDFAKINELRFNPFEQGITSCAGIAYIKAGYPFHYGADLAEKLCKEAKSVSKKLKSTGNPTPSSLMYHKVHSSYVEEYEDIIDSELKGVGDIRFNFGPYFIQEQTDYSTTKQLQDWIKEINKNDAPKSALRNWLTEIKYDFNRAMQLLERSNSILKDKRYIQKLNISSGEIFRKRGERSYTHIFDVINLSNIK